MSLLTRPRWSERHSRAHRGTESAARSGRGGGERWYRLLFTALLVGTAALYLVGLSASGWGNAFYAAAAQAGSVSWRAWFFGASDAPASIMVDKPPASLWVMGLSARLFGLSSWSLLVPQALMGVAAVGFLTSAVRRWSGPVAGLLAGLAFALTPVAVLMFRFDNPDALLCLLLVAGAWALVRSVDASSTRSSTWWLVLAAACIGTGFLTKSLQAFLVLPAFLTTHLVAGPGTWRRRLLALLPAGAALLVSAGWWVAVVELWPVASRPYVGGSQDDSVLSLAFGYNGVGRLTGDETGQLGGGGRGGGMGGATSTDSWSALFTGSMAAQVAWLLPLALIVGIALLVLVGRAARADRRRAGVLLWGGSLVVTAGVFSLAAGIIHPYYAVALAPWIAALAAVGVVELWRSPWRRVLAAGIAATAVWSWWLLRETPTFLPGLRAVVLAAGVLAALALLVVGARRLLAVAVTTTALLAGLGGPVAYAAVTASTAHTEIIPTAGPSGSGFGGGHGGRGGPGQHAAGRGGPGSPAPGRGGPGGAMALLRASEPSSALTSFLQAGATGHTWVAASVGSMPAAGYQLASGAPVMPLGGFNGTDPSPTLAEFQQLVAQGRVHYFLGAGLTSVPDTGGSDATVQITAWVKQHFAPTTVGGTTVYDLTTPVVGIP
ncbi:glycosyltransferase family 39 protein [Actinomycetospora atypica]|uniref:Glycosyltransferase family 39 protein n=1 Tax=Actinomycetospora atypica TaxID=1290095 RepID=A0ABV9YN79_9PSEU